MLAGENPLDYVERRMRERLAAAVERQQQYASAVVTGNQSNLSWSDVKKMHLEYSPRNGGAITVRNPSPTGGPPLPPPQGMLLDASVASSNSTSVNNNNIARRLELSPYRSNAAVQRPVALPPSTTVGEHSSSSFSSSSPTIASRQNRTMGSSSSGNPTMNAAGEVVAVKPCSASMVHDELWDRVHRDEAEERRDEGPLGSSVNMWSSRESPRLPQGAAWSQQQRRAELPTTSLDYNSRPQSNNNNSTEVKGAWPQRAAPQWSGDGTTRSHANDDSVAPHYGPLRSISPQSINHEELQRPQQPLQLQTLSPRSTAHTQPRPPYNVNLPSSSRLSDADNDQGTHKHYDPLSQGSLRNAPSYDGLCESAVPSYTTTSGGGSGGGGFTIDIPTMPWFRREAPPSNVESYRRQDMGNRALPARQSPLRQRRNGSAVAARHADVPSRAATAAVSSSRNVAHHYPSSYNSKKGAHPCWITVWQGFHRAGVSERVFVTMLDKYFSAFVCRAAKALQCLPPPTVLYTPDGVRIECFEDLQPNGHYLIFPSGSTYDEQHLPTLMLQILSTEA